MLDEGCLALMDDGRTFFRIVIGSYAEPQQLRLAASDLQREGLTEPQICAIAPADAVDDGEASRRIGGRPFHVSSEALFDRLWRQASAIDRPKAAWMTEGQADALWAGLLMGEHLLIVNTSTPDQQLRCSQIQLRHKPSRVQTYNFAM
jgi:hypothetical protein